MQKSQSGSDSSSQREADVGTGAASAAAGSIAIGQCGDWAAWIDKMPGAAHRLHVSGSCVFPTSGYKVTLRRATPQGINQRILILDKDVTAATGVVLEVITTVPMKYEEPAPNDFDSVEIRPGPVIPVTIAH